MYRDDVGLLGRMVRTRLAGRPLFLSHLVTARCNGRCAFCLWRFGAEDDELLAAAELRSHGAGGSAHRSIDAVY